jgi:hypothetical protein
MEPAQVATSFVGPPISPTEFEATPEEGGAGKKVEEPQEVKEFQLDIWPSDFVHEKYIRSPATNPLYGPFKPVSPENSFIGGALKQSVPPSLWAKGLMDWETDAVRRKKGSGGLEADLEHHEAAAIDGHLLKPETQYLRRRRRKQMKAIPRVMLGLRALKEEKERQLREEEERQILAAKQERQGEAEARHPAKIG